MVTLLTTLATRLVLTHFLGNEAVSVNGLFTEVIAMLSLAELGVGSAIVYSLYKPLHEKNTEKVRQLMVLFRKAYHIIAVAVMAIGLILMPFLQYLVDIDKVSWSLSNLRLIFILFVVKTAVSYLFSYKTALLNADQQAYLVSVVSIVFRVATCLGDVALLIFTKNFILYLVCEIVFTLLNNIGVSIVADKRYAFLKQKGGEPLPKDEVKTVFRNIKYLFISKASGVITNSTDNVLISVLVGTLSVGPYNQYAAIIAAAKSVFGKIDSGIMASIGNMMTAESSEKCSLQLKRMTFMLFVPTVLICVCFYTMLTPAVSLLYGKEYIIANAVVFVSVVNCFFWIVRQPLWSVLQASGLFRKDAWISVFASSLNLVVSIWLGKTWNMLGIFIGTTVTMVIQVILKTVLIYKDRFKLPMARFFADWVIYIALTLTGMLSASYLCTLYGEMNIAADLVFRFLISCAVSAVLILPFIKSDYFRYTITTGRFLIKRKLTKQAGGKK